MPKFNGKTRAFQQGWSEQEDEYTAYTTYPPAKLTGFLDSNILGLFISQHDELKETVWTEKKNPGKLKYKLQIRQEQVRSRRKVAYDMKQKHPRDPVTVL